MSAPRLTELAADGLWRNNPALVQVLGLCPLLAISNTTVNAIGLGIATLFVLTASNVLVSLIRHWVRPEVRLPVFVMVIASVVTAVELAMNAWLHELYLILGIFIPLIVTNCIVIARAEGFASRNRLSLAAWDGFMMGMGFALVLVALGAVRELLGSGTVLANAHLLFGDIARSWTLTLIPEYRGFLLAILPPGAFIALAFLIAAKNAIDARRKRLARVLPVSSPLPEGAH
ncbi:MAG: electron transport complex subunit E [Halothiobacillaceae bacterium]|jgi:electron transport complex protein RnfE|nr:electron transport complex subunit E [Halothiobacillaceae bacterium]MDY0050015.1 electron transport complex subunit E [Halothiobacillaceae bacterium]